MACSVRFIRAGYAEALELLVNEGLRADAAYFDLGMSSMQVDTRERGFSYSYEAPLDMRMDPEQELSAREIVAEWDERRLARTLRDFGEERHANAIARAIVRRRAQAPIETTLELVDTINSAIPAPARFAGGHPAKRVFQALRIAVNDELGQLDRALPLAWELLREGGVLAGISFHSLEDRRVKRFLGERARGCICPPDLPVCACGREPQAALIARRSIVPSAGGGRAQPARRLGTAARRQEADREWRSGVSAQATAAAPAARPSRTAAPAHPFTPLAGPGAYPARYDEESESHPPVDARTKERGLAVGLLGALGRLSRRRALGGRPWIALVAFALIGIVTLQLGLLKLNAGIGRALEHEAVLQRENAALSIENSELAASDRVTSRAIGLGMELIPSGALRFLAARPQADPARAVAALSTPARVSTTASGEASSAGPAVTRSSAAPTEPTTGSPTAPASGESSNTTTTSGEPSTAASAPTSASGESSGRASREAAPSSGESTSPSPAAAASPPARPSASATAEGSPVGGTGAGP